MLNLISPLMGEFGIFPSSIGVDQALPAIEGTVSSFFGL